VTPPPPGCTHPPPGLPPTHPAAGPPPSPPGFSELVAQRPGYWPPSVRAYGFWLQAHVRKAHPGCARPRRGIPPHSTYICEAAISSPPPHDLVRPLALCGLTARTSRLAAAWQLPEDLRLWLEDDAAATREAPPLGPSAGPRREPGPGAAEGARRVHGGAVAVDFGSMGRLGLLPPPDALLSVLGRALEIAGL
jgi:hypothetical protein